MISRNIVLLSLCLLATPQIHATVPPKCGVAVSPETNQDAFAQSHQSPWMVHISMGLIEVTFLINCAGSLIDDQWILTSAKCFYSGLNGVQIGTTIIVLGQDHISNGKNSTLYFDSSTQKIKFYTHEKYNSLHGNEHDIALIKLPSKIKFDQFQHKIAPICLPMPGEMIDTEHCQQLTWFEKAIELWPNNRDIWLKGDSTSMLNLTACREVFGNFSHAEDKLCASFSLHKLCHGPFGGAIGGPLQCKNAASQWVLQGIRSAQDYSCKHPYEPKFFTDVSKYMHWINETMMELEPVDNTTYPPISRDLKCGLNSVSNARIIGGENTKAHQFPWMAYLQTNFVNGNRYTAFATCGGFLIDQQWILSAAHCFESEELFNEYNNTIVLLGAHNVTDRAESRLQIETTKVFKHEKFRSLDSVERHANDIALVKLPVPLNFTQTGHRIEPICFPLLGEMISKTDCQVVGWGQVNSTKDSDSPDLRVAPVNWLNNQVCQKVYVHIDESKVCVGGTGKGACSGDSGGPFQCRNEAGHWVAVGVMASVYGNCDLDYPEVATNVLKHEHWINKIRALH